MYRIGIDLGGTNIVAGVVDESYTLLSKARYKEGETLLAPLRSYIERQRYSKHSARQTVLTTALLGNDAGIIGAAALCD